MNRRLARELALKILYWYESGNGIINAIIQNILGKKKYKNGVKNFCKDLVLKVLENQAEIDKQISDVLRNWDYNRISVIDRIILRMGTCEILFFNDIPYQVSINEAIEIGKKYGTEDSGRFINGILDAIRKKEHKKGGE